MFRLAQDYDEKQLLDQVEKVTYDLLEEAKLEAGQALVLGLSTSEVVGGQIGKNSNAEIGKAIVSKIKSILDDKGIYLATQGCEHINRALVVDRKYAKDHNLEIVNVKPALHAGGSGTVAAYDLLDDPVMVEHITADAGLDIGDTFIGMQVKFVQVPVRFDIDQIGQAHLTALRSRPKNIGGERAEYE